MAMGSVWQQTYDRRNRGRHTEIGSACGCDFPNWQTRGESGNAVLDSADISVLEDGPDVSTYALLALEGWKCPWYSSLAPRCEIDKVDVM